MGGRPARRSISNRRKTIVKVSRSKPSLAEYIYIHIRLIRGISRPNNFSICPAPFPRLTAIETITLRTLRSGQRSIWFLSNYFRSVNLVERGKKKFFFPPSFEKLCNERKAWLREKFMRYLPVRCDDYIKNLCTVRKHVYISERKKNLHVGRGT